MPNKQSAQRRVGLATRCIADQQPAAAAVANCSRRTTLLRRPGEGLIRRASGILAGLLPNVWHVLLRLLDATLPVALPTSPVRVGWTLLTLVLTLYMVIDVPLLIAFQSWRELPPVHVLGWLASSSFIFDIVLHFRTAYITDQGEIIRTPRLVASNYLHGMLPFDIVSALPLDEAIGLATAHAGATIHENMYWLGLLRLPRLFTLVRHLDTIMPVKYLNLLAVTRLLFAVLLITHWAACIWYFMSRQIRGMPWAFHIHCVNWSDRDIYMYAFYRCFLAILGDRPVVYNNIERGFAVFLLFGGACIYAIVMSSMTLLVSNMWSMASRHKQRAAMLQDALRYKHVSDPVRVKVDNYFDYMAQHEHPGPDGMSFMSELPAALHAEVMSSVFEPMLTRVQLFAYCEQPFLWRLAQRLRLSLFMARDAVYGVGSVGHEMYIIWRGVVGLVEPDGCMAALLNDGDHFGELGVMTASTPRPHRAVALQATDLMVLSRWDLQDAMRDFPDSAHLVKSRARVQLEDHEIGPAMWVASLTLGQAQQRAFHLATQQRVEPSITRPPYPDGPGSSGADDGTQDAMDPGKPRRRPRLPSVRYSADTPAPGSTRAAPGPVAEAVDRGSHASHGPEGSATDAVLGPRPSSAQSCSSEDSICARLYPPEAPLPAAAAATPPQLGSKRGAHGPFGRLQSRLQQQHAQQQEAPTGQPTSDVLPGQEPAGARVVRRQGRQHDAGRPRAHDPDDWVRSGGVRSLKATNSGQDRLAGSDALSLAMPGRDSTSREAANPIASPTPASHDAIYRQTSRQTSQQSRELAALERGRYSSGHRLGDTFSHQTRIMRVIQDAIVASSTAKGTSPGANGKAAGDSGRVGGDGREGTVHLHTEITELALDSSCRESMTEPQLLFLPPQPFLGMDPLGILFEDPAAKASAAAFVLRRRGHVGPRRSANGDNSDYTAALAPTNAARHVAPGSVGRRSLRAGPPHQGQQRTSSSNLRMFGSDSGSEGAVDEWLGEQPCGESRCVQLEQQLQLARKQLDDSRAQVAAILEDPLRVPAVQVALRRQTDRVLQQVLDLLQGVTVRTEDLSQQVLAADDRLQRLEEENDDFQQGRAGPAAVTGITGGPGGGILLDGPSEAREMEGRAMGPPLGLLTQQGASPGQLGVLLPLSTASNGGAVWPSGDSGKRPVGQASFRPGQLHHQRRLSSYSSRVMQSTDPGIEVSDAGSGTNNDTPATLSLQPPDTALLVATMDRASGKNVRRRQSTRDLSALSSSSAVAAAAQQQQHEQQQQQQLGRTAFQPISASELEASGRAGRRHSILLESSPQASDAMPHSSFMRPRREVPRRSGSRASLTQPSAPITAEGEPLPVAAPSSTNNDRNADGCGSRAAEITPVLPLNDVRPSAN